MIRIGFVLLFKLNNSKLKLENLLIYYLDSKSNIKLKLGLEIFKIISIIYRKIKTTIKRKRELKTKSKLVEK